MHMKYIFRVFKQEIAKALCHQGWLACIFDMVYFRFESSWDNSNVLKNYYDQTIKYNFLVFGIFGIYLFINNIGSKFLSQTFL